MQVEEQFKEDTSGIAHSPYYGCTVRVVSKARVSYEGVLDGISANKDRIYLKNVRVNANLTAFPNRISYLDNVLNGVDKNSTSDTLNAVMIDHLTNDIHIYEQVCLTVRDIQELRLIELPSTFHESKVKLRAIDPCLVDIRLSTSDEYETKSSTSSNDHPLRAPIGRQTRGESFGSNGDSAIISSSSNESSSSFCIRSVDKFADESNDESIDEQIEKFNQLTTTTSFRSKPVTLLAKKVLPKKIERRTDVQSTSSSIDTNNNNNNNNNIRQDISDNHEIINGQTRANHLNPLKKGPIVNDNRNASPIRVTITSKLNPNATPFFTEQRNLPATHNPSITFYERTRFKPRLQPVASPDRSQSVPYGINGIDSNHINQQQHQQNYPHTNQRYVSPRQMTNKKDYNQTNQSRTKTRPIRTPPPMVKYRIHSSGSLGKRNFPQQQYTGKTKNNAPFEKLSRQTSNQSLTTPSTQERLSMSRNNPTRRSTASIRSTISLPYQYGNTGDRNQMHTPLSFKESVCSYRSQRTFSGASSCSSASLDVGPHSIVQLDSSSNSLPLFEGQYDFEKANEEFRRYLELEELVIRRNSPNSSNGSGPD
ncbi:unnamed protein product, partial [Rotaria magnacalcarata]